MKRIISIRSELFHPVQFITTVYKIKLLANANLSKVKISKESVVRNVVIVRLISEKGYKYEKLIDSSFGKMNIKAITNLQ